MLTSVVHGQDMRSTYDITKDSQWKSAHRVRLKKVMSEKAFDDMYVAYDALESDALENFKANLSNVLSRVPYLDEHDNLLAVIALPLPVCKSIGMLTLLVF